MPTSEGKEWATLKLYCDWALHAGIRRRADFLAIADEEFSRDLDKADDWDPQRRLGKMLLMGSFRCQLVFFLEEIAIEHPFGIDDIAWSRFLRLYGQVLAGCPHQWRASRAKCIRSVKLRARDAVSRKTLDRTEAVLWWQPPSPRPKIQQAEIGGDPRRRKTQSCSRGRGELIFGSASLTCAAPAARRGRGSGARRAGL